MLAKDGACCGAEAFVKIRGWMVKDSKAVPVSWYVLRQNQHSRHGDLPTIQYQKVYLVCCGRVLRLGRWAGGCVDDRWSIEVPRASSRVQVASLVGAEIGSVELSLPESRMLNTGGRGG